MGDCISYSDDDEGQPKDKGDDDSSSVDSEEQWRTIQQEREKAASARYQKKIARVK